jgi:hypothetical protein
VIERRPPLAIPLPPRRAGNVAAAVVGAFIVVTYFTLLSGIAGARDYFYGGPIPIGRCHADFAFLGQNACDSGALAWLLFAVDVALVALFFAVIGERGGPGALAAAMAAALIAVQLAPRDGTGAVVPILAWMFIGLAALLAAFLSLPARGDRLRLLLRRAPPR